MELTEKEKKLIASRTDEKLQLAFDLGWLAAKAKKPITYNPYAGKVIENEENISSEVDIFNQKLVETWINGFNSFKGK